jgi:hypothetical protein
VRFPRIGYLYLRLTTISENNGMKLVNGYPTKSTFYYHNQKSTSQIDYIKQKSTEKNHGIQSDNSRSRAVECVDHTLVIADMSGTAKRKRETKT